MDRVDTYRSIVKRIILDYAEQVPSHGKIQPWPLLDENRDNYALIDVGWDRTGRVHAVVLHVRLQDGKVWIEQDGTEDGIADEFLAAGIPKEEIVLGFYRPERRAIGEFALA